MAEITAGLVKELRERTQLPMMDCKKALAQTDGDITKAEDFLRKSGAMAAASKLGRETAEGRVATYISDCSCCGAILQVRCETSPVANNDIFQSMCKKIAQHVAGLDAMPDSAEKLVSQKLTCDANQTVKDVMDDAINKLRENMQVSQFGKLCGGYISSYEHHNGQVAVLLQMEVDPSIKNNEQVVQLAKDLCMHITAVNPTAVTREQVPAEIVEKEKEIIKGQVELQSAGKPANIIEKMTMGKINKWYNDRVLLEQPFVKDDKKTVKQVIDEVSKAVGKPITVTKYLRFEVGGSGKAC
ncbi:MAG: translation elongation factor Ts [Phycisphaerae bacterium]